MYELRKYREIRPTHMGRRSGKKTYKKKKPYIFVRDVIIDLESVAGDNSSSRAIQRTNPDSSDDNSDGVSN